MKLAKIYGSLQNNQTTVKVSKQARKYVAQMAPDMLQDIVKIAGDLKAKRENLPKGILNRIGRFFLPHNVGDKKLIISRKNDGCQLINLQMSEWIKARTLSGTKRVDSNTFYVHVMSGNTIENTLNVAKDHLGEHVLTQKNLEKLKNI